MRKIIDGKMYDTATATLIAEHQYSSPREWDYENEELYLKKSGEWFLFGEGGSYSKYGKKCDPNHWCGGEAIKPLTEQEAKKWLEDNNYTDKYIEYFGEPAE